MPKTITVDGTKYEVTEQPSYNHDVGGRFAFVRTPSGEKPIVNQGGGWRFWGARDRTKPLRDAVAKGWPKE